LDHFLPKNPKRDDLETGGPVAAAATTVLRKQLLKLCRLFSKNKLPNSVATKFGNLLFRGWYDPQKHIVPRVEVLPAVADLLAVGLRGGDVLPREAHPKPLDGGHDKPIREIEDDQNDKTAVMIDIIC